MDQQIGAKGVVCGTEKRRENLPSRNARRKSASAWRLAQRSDVLGLVVRQGMTLAAIGVVAGLAGAFGLTRVMAGLLFHVRPDDPTTYLAISFLLIVVAFLACYLPARRAAKLDPLIALSRT